eukprot:Clim_evm150s147 gene=Clim_evmTU150s147
MGISSPKRQGSLNCDEARPANIFEYAMRSTESLPKPERSHEQGQWKQSMMHRYSEDENRDEKDIIDDVEREEQRQRAAVANEKPGGKIPKSAGRYPKPVANHSFIHRASLSETTEKTKTRGSHKHSITETLVQEKKKSALLQKGQPAAPTIIISHAEAEQEVQDITNKPTAVQLDRSQTYKRKHVDPFVKWLEKKIRKATTKVPVWISPNFFTLPGMILHILTLCLLIFEECPSTLPLYETPRCVPHQWIYGLWMFTICITWILDVVDGEHARNTKTQSPARHYFDHIFDAFNLCVAGIISGMIAPPVIAAPIYSVVLITASSFQLTFIAYYATGCMRVPYVVHYGNYVHVCFFLLVSVITGGDIWIDKRYMAWIYTGFIGLLVVMVVYYALSDIYKTIRAPLKWTAKILLFIPLVSTILFGTLQQIFIEPPQVLFAIAVSLVVTSWTNHIMAAQLIYRKPIPCPPEAIILIVETVLLSASDIDVYTTTAVTTAILGFVFLVSTTKLFIDVMNLDRNVSFSIFLNREENQTTAIRSNVMNYLDRKGNEEREKAKGKKSKLETYLPFMKREKPLSTDVLKGAEASLSIAMFSENVGVDIRAMDRAAERSLFGSSVSVPKSDNSYSEGFSNSKSEISGSSQEGVNSVPRTGRPRIAGRVSTKGLRRSSSASVRSNSSLNRSEPTLHRDISDGGDTTLIQTSSSASSGLRKSCSDLSGLTKSSSDSSRGFGKSKSSMQSKATLFSVTDMRGDSTEGRLRSMANSNASLWHDEKELESKRLSGNSLGSNGSLISQPLRHEDIDIDELLENQEEERARRKSQRGPSYSSNVLKNHGGIGSLGRQRISQHALQQLRLEADLDDTIENMRNQASESLSRKESFGGSFRPGSKRRPKPRTDSPSGTTSAEDVLSTKNAGRRKTPPEDGPEDAMAIEKLFLQAGTLSPRNSFENVALRSANGSLPALAATKASLESLHRIRSVKSKAKEPE